MDFLFVFFSIALTFQKIMFSIELNREKKPENNIESFCWIICYGIDAKKIFAFLLDFRIMSDVASIPMENTILVQRLQSAEKSIAFIQREHAATLTNLHEEIAKWQQKCSGQFDDDDVSSLLFIT